MRTVLLFVLCLYGCLVYGQTEDVEVAPFELGVTDTLVMSSAEERANELFARGLMARHRGDYTQSKALMQRVLDLSPEHVGALFELSTRLADEGEDSLAGVLMERAAALDGRNYWIRRWLSDFYFNHQQEDKAIAQLEQLARDYPRNSELLLTLASRYAKRSDYEAIVRMLDRVELLEGKSEQLSVQKFRCYVAMKDEGRAFAEIRALAEEYPTDVRYRVLIGDLYMDLGRQQEAYEEYLRIRKEHPDNAFLQLSLANYYEQTHQDSLMATTLASLVNNVQLDDDTRWKLMQNLVFQNLQQDEDTARVMPLIRSVLARENVDVRLCELAARYMVTRKFEPSQVSPVLRQMLVLDPTSEVARSQLLEYAVNENDTAEMVRLCEGAAALNMQSPVFYYYLGVGYFQQYRYADAARAFERGLSKTNERSSLQMVTNMYSILGELYHELGDNRRAYEMYDSCLLYRPDESMVLNNYAYYLSLEKRDLKKAAAMSLRSLGNEPRNATYLDTYAWILFCQKKYDEARVYIDSTLRVMGDSLSSADATLLEHAGDIYSMCGRTDEAMEFWSTAQDYYSELVSERNSYAEELERVARKIKRRKYVE